jgi:hypothetical protein
MELNTQAPEDSIALLASKLDRLIDILSSPVTPIDKTLWTADQAAKYLDISPRTLTESYALRRDFPSAIMLTEGTKKSTRRWNAAEVIAWADRQRQKKR